jgi:hypothetical protein
MGLFNQEGVPGEGDADQQPRWALLDAVVPVEVVLLHRRMDLKVIMGKSRPEELSEPVEPTAL